MSNNSPKGPAPKTPQPVIGKPGEAKAAPPPKATIPPSPPAVVPPLFRRMDWISFSLTTLLVFIGYWWTLAPDLTLEDCGELAVGSMYAGVPHPPGYPVWTIYSWFFTLLPISNIAYRVALSSAVAGALSCGLVALMVSRGSSMIIEGIAELKNLDRRWENALCVISGFVAGMLIGFNGFMWSQAVIVEVYTLSVLSLTGVLACLLRWVYAPHQRRYLYLAFFWFGICFNNHQSLLVIAMGLEVAIIAVSAKMGRDFLLWNVVIYVGGLILKNMGMIGMLSENEPLLIIYHMVGFASAITWIILLIKTRISGIELGRDFLLVGVLAYLGVLFLSITNFITFFEYKTGLFVLFNMAGLCLIAAFVYTVKQTKKTGTEWVATLVCGGAWLIGAAFYVYMPLASMTNPPLNWGYPRTVTGFFHAFTRGQYERIHPTTEVGRYIEQMGMYLGGAFEEFNVVYILIAIVPFLFIKKMQRRERAWLIGLGAIYITLSLFLLMLLNPAPDRQARDLNRVFFTASHVMIAMGTGYGLTLIGSYLATQYERWRKYCLLGALGAAAIALFLVVITYQGENPLIFRSQLFDLLPSSSPVIRLTAVLSLVVAVGAMAILYVNRTRAPMVALLVLFSILPFRSVISHWEDNEQRGHYFGYWFGHDMFTPPFNDPKTGKPLYPEMDADTVLYGGTDPGRFNPTYMIFCESFIPPSKRNAQDPKFDRRDVALITQNALADGTYLQYIRAHYNRSAQNDPPFFSELFRGPKEIEAGEKTNIIARMMRPFDRFFLKLGDDIEKKRRAGSSFFKEDHFTDLPGFIAKLRQGQDPLSQFLYENLSKETQQLLSQDILTGKARVRLAEDLSRLLERELVARATVEEKTLERDRRALKNATADVARLEQQITELKAVPPLYTPERFQHVKVSERTQRFIAQNPQSHTRIRLNRLLLEEAYPKEIARSLGGVYPDMEIITATEEDSRRCFKEYLDDAQRRLDHDKRFPNEPRQIKPGEDVRIVDNRVTVSGQVAVMAINALLTKVMFDKNPDREFYVEESFPLDWMYPYLTPYGIIMKINRNQVPEMTQEMVDRDHEFWTQFSKRLIGNWITYDTPVSNICAFAEKVYNRKDYWDDPNIDPRFARDNDGQKAFSKLRSSIAGVYNWRISNAKNPAEQQRMLKEADFAFKQAYAFCPYSPEALFRYVNLLIGTGRYDDALLIATTSQKLDPFNAQIDNLIFELKRIKASVGGAVPPGAAAAPDPNALIAQIAALEQQFKADPKNLQAGLQLAALYVQAQQTGKVAGVLDQIIANPQADANSLTFAANLYAQLGQLAKVEQSLVSLLKVAPDNPEGRYELAAFQAAQNKSTEALESLRGALQQSSQRLEKNPAALNLYSNALGDGRFAALRSLPDFNKVLDSFKPK
jgi:tetratricopeptide (TPR) repeat protein